LKRGSKPRRKLGLFSSVPVVTSDKVGASFDSVIENYEIHRITKNFLAEKVSRLMKPSKVK
jgi:hypothetical protein